MIQLENVSIAPGGNLLLSEINWRIHPGQRTALVGRNGTGKTTLIQTIIGEELPINGQITRSTKWKVGYLPQKAVAGSSKTLWEEVRYGMSKLRQAEQQLEKAQREAENNTPQAAENLAAAMEKWRQVGGYREKEIIGHTLHGLGFTPQDWNKSCAHFSGGWQMRIALAKLLLAEPDIAILDEPTNHLDLLTRSWLANHLSQVKYSVIIVSHDKYFLNKVAKEVVELRDKQLHFYKGNYTDFIRMRNERIQQLQNQYEKQQTERKNLQKFIDKFGVKATKAKQAQDRKKKLERMKQLERPEHLKSGPKLSIVAGAPSAYVAIEVQKATIGWEKETPLLQDVNIRLERGMRLAVIGPNGCGKSTLLKTFSGLIAPLKGQRRTGESLNLGVFSQDIAQSLPADHNPIEYLHLRHLDHTIEKIRATLGAMGLSSDAHSRSIGQLSGGEKARVALAELALGKYNTLVLDEPTNHLDVETASALADGLKKFEGAILIISHDRGLIEEAATHLARIEGNKVSISIGVTASLLEPQTLQRSITKRTNTENSFAEQRKKSNAVKKLKRQIEELEERIENLESQIEMIDENLLLAGENYSELAKHVSRKEEASAQLEDTIAKWEELHERLSDLT